MLIGSIKQVIFRRLDPAAGRRFHGSQVFDCWTDPAGLHLDYADGDIVNAENPALE